MRNRKKSGRVSKKELRRLSAELDAKVPGEFVTRMVDNHPVVEEFVPEVVEIPEQEEEGEKLVRITTESLYKDQVRQAENSAGKSVGERRLSFLDGQFQKLITGGGDSKIGVTRGSKSKSKNALKMEKKSRSKNAKIANKKFRPSGSKKNRGK